MNKPHKHAALIKAWADGAVIQYKGLSSGTWVDTPPHRGPEWREDGEYRIKPEPKEIVQWHRANSLHDAVYSTNNKHAETTIDQQVKWTIDPANGKILKVELVE